MKMYKVSDSNIPDDAILITDEKTIKILKMMESLPEDKQDLFLSKLKEISEKK